MNKKSLIYIAGPIRLPDPIDNARHALSIAEELIEQDYAVFVPHLSIFWHLVHPHNDLDWWLTHVDYPILARCDAMLRLPGDSEGADREEEFCALHNIPVFYCIEELRVWRDSLNTQKEG